MAGGQLLAVLQKDLNTQAVSQNVLQQREEEEEDIFSNLGTLTAPAGGGGSGNGGSGGIPNATGR